MCEGRGIQTDATFSHVLDRVCVCVVYLPDLSGLEVVVYDKPLSLLSVSSQPDICTKHSHNVMGTKPLYTRSAFSERCCPIQSPIMVQRGTSAVTVLSQSDAIEEIIHNLYIGYYISDLVPPVTSLDVYLQLPCCTH